MENVSSIEYVSLLDIMKILKKKIVFITLITILCTTAMASKIIFLSAPVYQADVSMIVVKGDTSIIQNPQYTEGDVSLYQKIVDTYVKIAQSNLVIDKTAEELKSYSSLEIRSMVTVAQVGQTQIIKVSARTADRDSIANIANVYCKNFIEQSTNILPVGKIRIMDSAKLPIRPVSTNIFINIAIGFLFGVFLSVAIVLFRYYLYSQKISNEKQIKNILNIPVLVTIE